MPLTNRVETLYLPIGVALLFLSLVACSPQLPQDARDAIQAHANQRFQGQSYQIVEFQQGTPSDNRADTRADEAWCVRISGIIVSGTPVEYWVVKRTGLAWQATAWIGGGNDLFRLLSCTIG